MSRWLYLGKTYLDYLPGTLKFADMPTLRTFLDENPKIAGGMLGVVFGSIGHLLILAVLAAILSPFSVPESVELWVAATVHGPAIFISVLGSVFVGCPVMGAACGYAWKLVEAGEMAAARLYSQVFGIRWIFLSSLSGAILTTLDPGTHSSIPWYGYVVTLAAASVLSPSFILAVAMVRWGAPRNAPGDEHYPEKPLKWWKALFIEPFGGFDFATALNQIFGRPLVNWICRAPRLRATLLGAVTLGLVQYLSLRFVRSHRYDLLDHKAFDRLDGKYWWWLALAILVGVILGHAVGVALEWWRDGKGLAAFVVPLRDGLVCLSGSLGCVGICWWISSPPYQEFIPAVFNRHCLWYILAPLAGAVWVIAVTLPLFSVHRIGKIDLKH